VTVVLSSTADDQLSEFDLGIQGIPLTSASGTKVSVDTNTVMLTSAPAPGDTLQFYGLVFNDHGTLRLDCARISPGVTELSQ
jgi:hypothetical protein